LAIEQDDRRSAPRFDFEVPLTVTIGGNELHTVTEDLSSHGLQFSLMDEQESRVPDVLELTLTLSPEVTLANPREVWCQVRVVRKIRSQIKGVGIAAKIEAYRQLGPAKA